jgi:hypothetical protein
MEQYKGFNIYENIRAVNKSNIISGHKWTEHVDATGFTIELITATGLIYKRAHRTVKLAKEEIDFALKFPFYADKFPFTSFLAEQGV